MRLGGGRGVGGGWRLSCAVCLQVAVAQAAAKPGRACVARRARAGDSHFPSCLTHFFKKHSLVQDGHRKHLPFRRVRFLHQVLGARKGRRGGRRGGEQRAGDARRRAPPRRRRPLAVARRSSPCPPWPPRSGAPRATLSTSAWPQRDSLSRHNRGSSPSPAPLPPAVAVGPAHPHNATSPAAPAAWPPPLSLSPRTERAPLSLSLALSHLGKRQHAPHKGHPLKHGRAVPPQHRLRREAGHHGGGQGGGQHGEQGEGLHGEGGGEEERKKPLVFCEKEDDAKRSCRLVCFSTPPPRGVGACKSARSQESAWPTLCLFCK